MSDVNTKRRYRNTLDFVEGGFKACWRNANDLVAASKSLIDQGLHAPGLSLAVLALDEIGKLCAVDGLLYARADGHKSKIFNKSQREHFIKLMALPLLPLFITNLSRADPRSKNDLRYITALENRLHKLAEDIAAVLQQIKKGGLAGLDKWKQQGLYVGISQNSFVTPRETVDLTFAKAVHRLAWRAISTLDFVLNDDNLHRYIERARSTRAKLAESDDQAFEQVGQQLADILLESGETPSGKRVPGHGRPPLN
jgi:AbiV family abortive infection protein